MDEKDKGPVTYIIFFFLIIFVVAMFFGLVAGFYLAFT